MDFAVEWWALVVAAWIAAILAHRWENEVTGRQDRRSEGVPRPAEVVCSSESRLR